MTATPNTLGYRAAGVALLLLLAWLLAGCESPAAKQARAIRQHQAAVLAAARTDSARAAAHVDSATTYARRQHEMAPTSATDTTALRRFFADFFRR